MKYYVDGLGETAGGTTFAGIKPIYSSGDIWYINSVTGADSGSTPSNKQAPFATLTYALSVGAAGDIFVLESGHVETFAGATTLLNGMLLIGIGTSGGKPGAKLSISNAAAYLGCSSEFSAYNVWFAASTATTGSNGNMLAGQTVYLEDCLFESGAFDTKPWLYLSNSAAYLTNCRFACVQTTPAVTAVGGLKTANSCTVKMNGVSFDGGTLGYSGYAADMTTAALSNGLLGVNVSQLNGADIGIHASTAGRLHVLTATGGARVVW